MASICSETELQAKIEQSVLSVLSIKPSILKESNIDNGMFMFESNRRLYISMKNNLHGENFDLVGIYSDMGSDGFQFFNDIQNSFVSVENYENDLSRLEESYKFREAQRLLNNTIQSRQGFTSFNQSIKKLDEKFSDLEAEEIDVNEIYKLVTTESKKLQFDNHFDNLGKMQNGIGFLENTLNVIAARPSVGKSAFALNMFNSLSKNEKYRCIYLNMEMGENEIFTRLIGINTGLNIENLPKATIEQSGKTRAIILNCLEEIKQRKIKIINHSMSIESIGKMIVKEKRNKHNQGKHLILFVDYLGYVQSSKNTNDREKMGDIVRRLQIMTKDYECTIFLLAQINRSGADKPTLENLKDTGELEQSGHCVLILDDIEADQTKTDHLINVNVAKNRSGMRGGTILFIFKRDCQRFFEIQPNEGDTPYEKKSSPKKRNEKRNENGYMFGISPADISNND